MAHLEAAHLAPRGAVHARPGGPTQADVYAYLLRRNAAIFGMWFALGPEDAVYLVGRVPARLIDDDELDRIAGSSVIYVDDHFPTRP